MVQNAVAGAIFGRLFDSVTWTGIEHAALDAPVEEFADGRKFTVGRARRSCFDDCVQQPDDLYARDLPDVALGPSRYEPVLEDAGRILCRDLTVLPLAMQRYERGNDILEPINDALLFLPLPFLFGRDGIDALLDLAHRCVRLVASFGQGEHGISAQCHTSRLAAIAVDEHERLGARTRYPDPETRDLKILRGRPRAGSSPAVRTNKINELWRLASVVNR